VAPGDRPFGVDYRCDAHAAQAVAAVSGASFIREVIRVDEERATPFMGEVRAMREGLQG